MNTQDETPIQPITNTNKDIKPSNSITDMKPTQIEDSSKNPNPPTINGIKLVSNLAEGQNFSKKIYSDCGLVIRTKPKYLVKFCDICKGYLSKVYGVDEHPCKYCIDTVSTQHTAETLDIKRIDEITTNESTTNNLVEDIVEEKPVKTVKTIAELFGKPKSDPGIKNAVIQSIKDNASILSKTLDDKISSVQEPPKIENTLKMSESEDVDMYVKPFISTNTHVNVKKTKKKTTVKTINGDTTIEPVCFDNYKKCTSCHEYYERGFLVNNEFQCRSCTQKDFISYFNLRKGVK